MTFDELIERLRSARDQLVRKNEIQLADRFRVLIERLLTEGVRSNPVQETADR